MKVTQDITERRRLTEALSLREAELRLIIDGVRDHAISLLDPQGRIRTFNASAERIKGYKLAEVQGRHFEMFFTPEDRAAGLPERELASARAQGRAELEGWRQKKDGSKFYAAVSISALRDDNRRAGRIRQGNPGHHSAAGAGRGAGRERASAAIDRRRHPGARRVREPRRDVSHGQSAPRRLVRHRAGSSHRSARRGGDWRRRIRRCETAPPASTGWSRRGLRVRDSFCPARPAVRTRGVRPDIGRRGAGARSNHAHRGRHRGQAGRESVGRGGHRERNAVPGRRLVQHEPGPRQYFSAPHGQSHQGVPGPVRRVFLQRRDAPTRAATCSTRSPGCRGRSSPASPCLGTPTCSPPHSGARASCVPTTSRKTLATAAARPTTGCRPATSGEELSGRAGRVPLRHGSRRVVFRPRRRRRFQGTRRAGPRGHRRPGRRGDRQRALARDRSPRTRARGGGQPRQGRVPRHPEPRAAHAAQRDPRLDADAARRGSLADEKRDAALETIERNARAQAAARSRTCSTSVAIISGKLRLDVQPVELAHDRRGRARGRAPRRRRQGHPRRSRVLDPDAGTVHGRRRPAAAGRAGTCSPTR